MPGPLAPVGGLPAIGPTKRAGGRSRARGAGGHPAAGQRAASDTRARAGRRSAGARPCPDRRPRPRDVRRGRHQRARRRGDPVRHGVSPPGGRGSSGGRVRRITVGRGSFMAPVAALNAAGDLVVVAARARSGGLDFVARRCPPAGDQAPCSASTVSGRVTRRPRWTWPSPAGGLWRRGVSRGAARRAAARRSRAPRCSVRAPEHAEPRARSARARRRHAARDRDADRARHRRVDRSRGQPSRRGSAQEWARAFHGHLGCRAARAATRHPARADGRDRRAVPARRVPCPSYWTLQATLRSPAAGPMQRPSRWPPTSCPTRTRGWRSTPPAASRSRPMTSPVGG